MEKRRKELTFLVLGVVLLGGALYTTFKPRAKPAAAEQPKQVAKAPAAQVEEPREPAEPATQEPGATKQQPSQLHRDPFRGGKSNQSVASSSTSAAKPSGLDGLPRLQPMPIAFNAAATGGPQPLGVLPFPGLTGPSTGPPNTPGTMPGTAPKPGGTGDSAADNTLRVTGIIEGEPTVAILRKGDARYIVQVGDPVQGYVVESIRGRRVALAAGGQKVSLFLGGRL